MIILHSVVGYVEAKQFPWRHPGILCLEYTKNLVHGETHFGEELVRLGHPRRHSRRPQRQLPGSRQIIKVMTGLMTKTGLDITVLFIALDLPFLQHWVLCVQMSGRSRVMPRRTSTTWMEISMD